MASTLIRPAGHGEIYYGSATVTVSALAAADEEDLTITDANAAAAHVVSASFRNADLETGMGIIHAWVSVAGTVKLRITNASGSGLTGGSKTVYYTLIKV